MLQRYFFGAVLGLFVIFPWLYNFSLTANRAVAWFQTSTNRCAIVPGLSPRRLPIIYMKACSCHSIVVSKALRTLAWKYSINFLMSCKPHSATYSLLIIGFLLCSDIFTRLKSMTQMYTTINGFPDNETKPSAMKLLIATSIIHSAYSQKKKKKREL